MTYSEEALAALEHLKDIEGISGDLFFQYAWLGTRVEWYDLRVDGERYRSYNSPHLVHPAMQQLKQLRKSCRAEELWYVATLVVPAVGPVAAEFDTVRPPCPSSIRDPGNYIADLVEHPRSPAQVPGWMKVELAAFGAWDLVSDEPAFTDDFEPLVVPMTPESAGVPLPPGGEYALRVEGFPELAYWNVPDTRVLGYRDPPEPVDVRGWSREQRRVPVEEQATWWGRCRRGGHLKPATIKKLKLTERWTALAALAPAGVITLEPATDPDTGVGIAPACRKAADVFAGVRLIDIPFGWSTDPDDGQPFAGNRYTYQPIQWLGRDGITIRIDPNTGAAGDVESYINGEPTTIATDAAEFWDTFTTYFEDNLQPALEDVLPDADGDPDDEYELATETVDTLISAFPNDA